MSPSAFNSNALWNTDLIRKYDLVGPRYTSYPTALQFHSGYGEQDWLTSVTASTSGDLSLYVHVPFCDTVCYYCGCNKIITANQVHAEKYLGYLKREISLKARQISAERSVTQIHLGGGTPTYFSDEQLSDLLSCLGDHFDINTSQLECAIEIHPQTVNRTRLKHLRQIGFNRLSIGVQDFNPEVQAAVNRFNSQQEVEAIVHQARGLEYQSISMDLIYGLPKQTVESFAQTLAEIIELGPDRISLFNYAHMPHLFKTQRQIDASQLPEPQDKLQILHDSISTLQQNGYAYIGMDHFAKQDDELTQAQNNRTLQRNFQGYATGKGCDLHGFGLSSISSFDQQYAQNLKQLDQYYLALDNGKLPIEKGYKLNTDDALRREIINTLMCQFELDITGLEKQYAINFFDYFDEELVRLANLERDGLLELNEQHIRICPPGRLLIRTVCQIFDRYSAQAKTQDQRYSRII